jgi:geranylgeranyl diphosphate synthase type II
MINNKQYNIDNIIKEKRIIIDQKLNSILREIKNNQIRKIMEYTCLNGAQRWRPILLILTYETYKPFSDKILQAACAIEIIHNGSLILDDLPSMDNSPLRRNKESCHLKFNEVSSILIGGPYSVSLAYNLLKPNEQAISGLHQTIEDMIDGQINDLKITQQSLKNKEKYIIDCYSKKTGALFSYATRLGGILAQAPIRDLRILSEYGNNLGISYQFLDDIKDNSKNNEIIKLKNAYYKKALIAIEKVERKPEILKSFLNYVLN